MQTMQVGVTVEHRETRKFDARLLVSWLAHRDAQRLLGLMNRDRMTAAGEILDAYVEDASIHLDLKEANCKEAMLEALAYRISPEISDPEEVVTELIPRYDRFATDLRAA